MKVRTPRSAPKRYSAHTWKAFESSVSSTMPPERTWRMLTWVIGLMGAGVLATANVSICPRRDLAEVYPHREGAQRGPGRPAAPVERLGAHRRPRDPPPAALPRRGRLEPPAEA